MAFPASCSWPPNLAIPSRSWIWFGLCVLETWWELIQIVWDYTLLIWLNMLWVLVSCPVQTTCCQSRRSVARWFNLTERTGRYLSLSYLAFLFVYALLHVKAWKGKLVKICAHGFWLRYLGVPMKPLRWWQQVSDFVKAICSLLHSAWGRGFETYVLLCFFGQLTWINHIVGHIGTTLIPPRPVDINIPALP